ncbi:VLRF1 family aeRF1-type release factor [Streptomyces sp. NPDC059637]|uniref:VLRF1 family aeRF1-type release factor n=1 Tax=Streptomyces sp. NPDC059637 TaxID=3347752 RepID=UPI0036B819CB
MEFVQEDLRLLAGMTDETGVLSVYVTADPRQESTTRPAWQVRVENGLAALRERARTELPRERRTVLEKRLQQLGPSLHSLVQASRPGLGRALFAPVSDGEVRTVEIQMPLPDVVTLEPSAHIRPLAAAANAGAPAGVAAVGREGLRLLDLRFGRAREVRATDFTIEFEDWRRSGGPASGNPSSGQQNVSQVDRFHNRLEDRLGRLLSAATSDVVRHTTEQGWQYLVVSGERRLVEMLADRLPEMHGTDVVRLSQVLHPLSPAKVAEAVGPALAEARQRREQRLVEKVMDAALSGGTGTCGLSDTLGSLNEGRVAHLLIDGEKEWPGSRARDGRLFPEGERAPDGPETDPEPELGERMIERALLEGAEVTVLAPESAPRLAGTDGVAALLRW